MLAISSVQDMARELDALSIYDSACEKGRHCKLSIKCGVRGRERERAIERERRVSDAVARRAGQRAREKIRPTPGEVMSVK